MPTSCTPNLLEVVVLEHDDGTESAIHAMVMREAYERLLPGQEMDRER